MFHAVAYCPNNAERGMDFFYIEADILPYWMYLYTVGVVVLLKKCEVQRIGT